MKKPDIKYLFEPRGVAVVGASHHKEKIGYKVLENLISGGYSGKIYPINPKGGTILGRKVYTDISEVPGPVDVACIVIPAKYVFDSVKACADCGVKFAPIITSGFAEVGNLEEEKRIVRYANKHGMRILGPNIFGVYCSKTSMNATFGPDSIQPGGVAIVTQSGALGLSMIGKTAVEQIGLSAIVSVGNKSDIAEHELLEYIVTQQDTKVVLLYLEGVRDGKKLLSVLSKAAKKKPIIAIKSGRSAKGAIAVASHTGSLAGTDDIFEAVMAQSGVLRAESISEAFNWCKVLVKNPLPRGKNTVIITNGGGIGVMAADACEKYGVRLYDDLQILKKLFSSVTPNFGSIRNPVDITGQATAKDYDMALAAAFASKDVDTVIALYCETAVFEAEKLAPMIETNYKRYLKGKKPLIFSIFGGENVESALQELRRKGVPVFDDVYSSVSSLGVMQRYVLIKNKKSKKFDLPELDFGAIDKIAKKALLQGRLALDAKESTKVMRIAGIGTPDSRVANDLKSAVDAAEQIGYPVVMKIVSPNILHKSDVGGVALDLEDKKEVIDAYQAMISACKARKPDAKIMGVEISQMISGGVEIIVGGRKDRSFGPIVMCGLGGVYVEVIKDISFRYAPISNEDISSMIKEIKSYPILLGIRGGEIKDIDALISTIAKVSVIISKCNHISDIEINPLSVFDRGKGVGAVDVRILLLKQENK